MLERAPANLAEHSPRGLAVFRGPGVRAGLVLPSADIGDLTATLFHLTARAAVVHQSGRVLDALFVD